MIQKITYDKYFDKLYGCFLGKTISGTIGAPYEGVKMPLTYEYRPEMVDVMLPNDDLDLQILWLDVVRERGADFTSGELLERFVDFCDYSPGEYGVMRKNYHKGIMPPYSGIFDNGYYREGMGCPIRSELWACLAPGNPALAAEFARRDGIIDHDSEHGESHIAEMFFAALEAKAFFEDDMHTLVQFALNFTPRTSRFRRVITDTVTWCDKYGDITAVLKRIMFACGHPDCTNMYQNMAITVASLLLGENDIIKTSLMALNCGFDTDCTCASAGSVVGILQGAEKIKRDFKVDDISYKLTVRSERRSDRVRELCEDIAEVALDFAGDANPLCEITDAPAHSGFRRPVPPFVCDIVYAGGKPYIERGGSRTVMAHIENKSAAPVSLGYTLDMADGFTISGDTSGRVTIPNGCSEDIMFELSLSEQTKIVREKNIFTLTLCGGGHTDKVKFGLSGSAEWKLTGPIWRTEPVTDTASIDAVGSYGMLIGKSRHEGNDIDKLRNFHVNMEPDEEIAEKNAAENGFAGISDEQLFAPPSEDANYLETAIKTPECTFDIHNYMGFSGACTIYLTREIWADEEMKVFFQVGRCQPYKMWLNGDVIEERHDTAVWTSENEHIPVTLHRGVNRLKWRITLTNADDRFSLIVSAGPTCADHIVSLGSVSADSFGCE
ncbi:MAG: ADP-ribosylglycohydrolase family protein [Eubacteriales bacterium]